MLAIRGNYKAKTVLYLCWKRHERETQFRKGEITLQARYYEGYVR